MEKQILIIYAATSGHLNGVPVESVGRYERELYTYFETEKADILEAIRDKGEIGDELSRKINDALKAFDEAFEPGA